MLNNLGLVFLGLCFFSFAIKRKVLVPTLVWESLGLALIYFDAGRRWGLQLRYFLLIAAVTLVAALFDPFIFRLHLEEARKEKPKDIWVVFGIINLWVGLVMLGAYLLGVWLA